MTNPLDMVTEAIADRFSDYDEDDGHEIDRIGRAVSVTLFDLLNAAQDTEADPRSRAMIYLTVVTAAAGVLVHWLEDDE